MSPVHRSYLPLAIAGGFAVALLVVLTVVLWPKQAVPPSPRELAGDYAKGMQYERGDGVTADYAQAVAWYRKAAEGNYPQAEYALGLMTAAGHGVVRDQKAATAWFRRAAEHGFAEAQVHLAGDLITGAATADGKPDKIEALKWLLIGAPNMPDALSQQVAIATRDTLSQEMTPEDRSEAARRTDEWRKQHAAPQ
jgi:TPR repeat protein